jgi:hypothetical protein
MLLDVAIRNSMLAKHYQPGRKELQATAFHVALRTE